MIELTSSIKISGSTQNMQHVFLKSQFAFLIQLSWLMDLKEVFQANIKRDSFQGTQGIEIINFTLVITTAACHYTKQSAVLN